MKATYKQVTKASYIRTVSQLASEIWTECYRRALPGKQMNLALEQFQSPDAIDDAVSEGVNYFLAQIGGKDIGYFAFHIVTGAVVLDHIYLRQGMRTRGLGRDILAYIEKLAASEGHSCVRLTVFQKCQDTVTFFKHRGYRIANDTVLEIEGGQPVPVFVMEKGAGFRADGWLA